MVSGRRIFGPRSGGTAASSAAATAMTCWCLGLLALTATLSLHAAAAVAAAAASRSTLSASAPAGGNRALLSRRALLGSDSKKQKPYDTCVCVFDFDETLRVISSDKKDWDVPAQDGAGIIAKCKEYGWEIGVASANDNVQKLHKVLGQKVDNSTFTQEFFDSSAFQYHWYNKTVSLDAIARYYDTQPECMMLFDDMEHNRKYAEALDVTFMHVRNDTGVRWSDFVDGQKYLHDKCWCAKPQDRTYTDFSRTPPDRNFAGRDRYGKYLPSNSSSTDASRKNDNTGNGNGGGGGGGNGSGSGGSGVSGSSSKPTTREELLETSSDLVPELVTTQLAPGASGAADAYTLPAAASAAVAAVPAVGVAPAGVTTPMAAAAAATVALVPSAVGTTDITVPAVAPTEVVTLSAMVTPDGLTADPGVAAVLQAQQIAAAGAAAGAPVAAAAPTPAAVAAGALTAAPPVLGGVLAQPGLPIYGTAGAASGPAAAGVVAGGAGAGAGAVAGDPRVGAALLPLPPTTAFGEVVPEPTVQRMEVQRTRKK
ncbi:hypothetical protein PLESTM_000282100 [Pleodorina starrii]|nr:hypothetical protein PLESTM_000282100 [Pleodorina starrii]